MSKGELDNILLGQIMTFTSIDERTKPISNYDTKSREKVNAYYYHGGHQICWKTFAYLHNIGKQIDMVTYHVTIIYFL